MSYTMWDNYIRIPFLDGGRNFDGVDCWGLVCLIYKLELKIELPSYGDISAFNLMRVVREISGGAQVEPWVPVDDFVRPYDVCVMRVLHGKSVGHVGVMISPNVMIHTEKGVGTSLVPLSHFSIRERIAMFRRHRELAK